MKAPFLKGASLLIVGECVQAVCPDVYKKFVESRTVLTSCPQAENVGSIADKLASIIRCSAPKEIGILTMDGSSHCFTLHAALNNALFATGLDIPSEHFVIFDGKAVEVSSKSVMVGRYLHLVEKCIESCPEILEDLSHYSLEHRCSARQK